jgi:hypothetical protein
VCVCVVVVGGRGGGDICILREGAGVAVGGWGSWCLPWERKRFLLALQVAELRHETSPEIA